VARRPFNAARPSLLDEVWITPYVEAIYLSPDGGFLARREGHVSFDQFFGAEEDLIRNMHRVAKVAELDGDEVGNLMGRVAEIKRIR
jgi:hypothetical protein